MKKKKKAEEEEEQIDERLLKEHRTEKQEKQLKMAVVFMAVLIGLIFAFYFWMIGVGSFEYEGLEFQKVKEGDLIFYETRFPIKKLTLTGNIVGELDFFFRNDPRTLDDIDVEEEVVLSKYIAIAAGDSEIEKCKETALAASTLSLFLTQLDFDTYGATTNKTLSEETGRVFIGENCEKVRDTGILFKTGKENKITKQGNCYVLEAKNCNTLRVTEKFILEFYLDAQDLPIIELD